MTEESLINTNVAETTNARVKNCIFCDLIVANNPNIILEPRVRIVFIYFYVFMKLYYRYLPIIVYAAYPKLDK